MPSIFWTRFLYFVAPIGDIYTLMIGSVLIITLSIWRMFCGIELMRPARCQNIIQMQRRLSSFQSKTSISKSVQVSSTHGGVLKSERGYKMYKTKRIVGLFVPRNLLNRFSSFEWISSSGLILSHVAFPATANPIRPPPSTSRSILFNLLLYRPITLFGVLDPSPMSGSRLRLHPWHRRFRQVQWPDQGRSLFHGRSLGSSVRRGTGPLG